MADILILIIFILVIIQSHYQIGLYKHYPKVMEFKLLYATLCIVILQTMDFYSPYELTSFIFLLPYFLFIHLITNWIIDMQEKRVLLINLIANNSP